MSSDQRLILAGMVGAALFSLAFVAGAHAWLTPSLPAIDTPAERVAWVLRYDFWAALALLAGVGVIANRRFFGPDMDGAQPARERTMRVNVAYVRNTTEQLLLLLFAHVGLALVAEPAALALVPALVVLFLIGRATFWLGYLHSAPARAFGFGTTFYPTVVVLVWTALRLAR